MTFQKDYCGKLGVPIDSPEAITIVIHAVSGETWQAIGPQSCRRRACKAGMICRGNRQDQHCWTVLTSADSTAAPLNTRASIRSTADVSTNPELVKTLLFLTGGTRFCLEQMFVGTPHFAAEYLYVVVPLCLNLQRSQRVGPCDPTTVSEM